MATPQSPSRFNGLIDDDPLFSDINFTEDISQKMRVPKRIKATGEFSDEDNLLSNQNGIMNSWNYNDKIDMNVPDRIVVIGQDQHMGTRSAPREIVLENSILPKDPGFVRVATPPRVITLNQHHFPSAADNDDEGNNKRNSIDNGEESALIEHDFKNDIGTPLNSNSERHILQQNISRKMLNQTFDGNTSYTDNMTPSEEITHLRRQLTKLNRRVHCIELENLHRQQREKIIYCLGLAYFLLKAIFWLNRN